MRDEHDHPPQASAGEERGRRFLSELRPTLVRRVLRVVAVVGFVVVLLGSYTALELGQFGIIAFYIAAYALILVGLFSKRIPYRVTAAYVTLIPLLLGIEEIVSYGWGGDGRILLVAFPVLATLFFGQRLGFVALGLSCIALVILAGLLAGGVILPPPTAPVVDLSHTNLLSSILVFVMVGALLVAALNFFTTLLSQELARVTGLSVDLETQRDALNLRQKALQSSNYALQRRAMHLAAGAEVGQTIMAIFDLPQLLSEAVIRVSEVFGFYHTGIFLCDDNREWAVLKAASSVGGQLLMAEGHRLHRGEGMVGWVLEHRQPRIALDVNADSAHFLNPQLPATRSEVTLPLLIGGRIIGVLDVQSIEEDAFDEDDVRALGAFAGQLAVAIENARRFAEESGAFEAASPFYRMARQMAASRTMQDVYTVIIETMRDFKPVRGMVFVLDKDSNRVEVGAELRGDRVVLDPRDLSQTDLASHRNMLALGLALDAPLFIMDTEDLDTVPEAFRGDLGRLRDHTGARSLGIIPVRAGEHFKAQLTVSYHTLHVFSTAEKRLYAALADLAAVALENMGLLETARQRAEHEQMIGEVTTRMRETLDVDTVLRTVIREIGDALGLDEVEVRMASEVPESPGGDRQEVLS
ncbi:MAG: GAF domain-containing protein [Anaerolineae bacterium]|nr:GAF domain-containing protein [Anaerolineae bacterium]